MKNLIKKYRSQIITGVIVTIIVNIIHWLWNYIAHGLPIAGNAIFSALINSLYATAATHNASSASMILLLVLVGWLFATIIYYLIKLFKLRFNRNRIEKLRKQIEQISASTTASTGESTAESTATDREAAKREAAKAIDAILTVPKKKEKKHKVISTIGIVVISLYLLWASIFIVFPVFLWQAFDVSTTQIRPYISDIEMDNLKSKWTLMKSKEDFVEINSYILKIREENGLIR